MVKLHSFICFLSVLFIFSGCQKEFSIEDGNTGGTTTGTAVFTFTGSPGNCQDPVINGKFQAGTPLDTSNRITAQVEVTTIGTYSILSNSTNGVTFSATGAFTTTGLQNIVFTATGTPAVAGSFNFTLGTGGCTVSVNCLASSTNNSDCKECSYVPLCVGSEYSYYDTISGSHSINTKDLLSSIDTTIDAKTYQKITASNGVGYYNCTNGETTAIGYQLVSNNGNTVEKVRLTMLKANAGVGTTWSDSVTNSLGQTIIQKFKITAKGISKNVGTFSFPDIIVVNLETGLVVPVIGYYVATISDYYYANGVGLVEMTSQDPNTGQSFYHSVIKSYFIP